MVDELMRRFAARSSAAVAPSPPSAPANVTPALADPEPPPPAFEEEGIEACGCFDAVRGPGTARGFRVRLQDRFFSCQYLAFLRTGEASGWDAELGREVLYVIFHWGTLVVAGKGLVVLDELLNDHKLARLSLGEGARGVRIDDIRVVTHEAVPSQSPKRRPAEKSAKPSPARPARA